MLNRDQLQELGRFKLLMRRACQETVHIEQFLTDRRYQSQMLDMAEDQDDDELLLMLAVTLRGRLGRLGDGEEAFEQICPKVVTAKEMIAELSAEPEVPEVAVSAVAVEVAEVIAPERAAVRSRSVLSSLFSTSANRASTASSNVAPDTTPRYVHSLR